MDRAALAESLKDYPGLHEARLDMLARLSEVYGVNRRHDAEIGCALHRCCLDAEACWAGADARRPSEALTAAGVQPGSIFWPWIGAEYAARAGVCLIAQNLYIEDDGWWCLDAQWSITRGFAEGLAAGHRRHPEYGSEFGYMSSATAAAVMASLAGSTPVALPEATELADVVERYALVQAVKCSPLGERGKPANRMDQRCPRRYLGDELKILDPAVVVALGAYARYGVTEAFPHAHRFTDWVRQPHETFHRGFVTIQDREVPFLVLPHPSAQGPDRWELGQARLVESLLTEPLA